MRNTLAFIGAAVVTVCGAGYYLGWYQIRTNPTSEGKRSFNVDVNTNKISEDLHKGTTKVQEFIDRPAKDADRANVEKGKEEKLQPVKDSASKPLQLQIPITGNGAIKPVQIELPLPTKVPLPGGATFKPFGGEESEPADFSRPR